MDWLILIVLVPLVLFPLVLLFGFPGCGDLLGLSEADDSSTETPEENKTPTLTAKAIAYDQIELTWTDPNAGNTIRIRRQGPAPSSSDNEIASQVIFPPYVDGKPPTTPLKEESLYTYRIKSLVPNTETVSGESSSALATTLSKVWLPTYDRPLIQADLNYGAYCLVQRINSANLMNVANKGNEVRITLRRPFGTPITINNIYISQAAAAGDPWNSHGDLKQVASGVSLPVTLADGTAGPPVITLPPVPYELDPGKDLIVALDVGATGGETTSRPLPGATCYVKGTATGEAALQVRPGTYNGTTNKDKVLLIEKIEVASSAPPPPPKKWKPAYDRPVTQDDANYGSYCLVQRINKAQLLTGGNEVRITLRRPFGGNITINSIYMSQPAAGGDPWNSHTDLKQVAPGAVSLAAGGPPTVTLPPVAYALDNTQDLIVAFDISAAGGTTASRPLLGSTCYTKITATGEAAQTVRPGPYDGVTNKDKVLLIDRIEVA